MKIQKLSVHEKQNIISQLLKKGVSYRKIATDFKISTREISKIKKENDRSEEQEKKLSEKSKIIDNYINGRNPFQVSKDFKIELKVAKSIYLEFLESKNLHQIVELEMSEKNLVQSLVNLHYFLKDNNLTKYDPTEIIKISKDTQKVKLDNQKKLEELKNNETRLDGLDIEIKSNNYKNSELIDENNKLEVRIKSKRRELKVLDEKIKHTKNLLKKMETDRDYSFLKDRIWHIAERYIRVNCIEDVIHIIFEEIEKDKEFLEEIVNYEPIEKREYAITEYKDYLRYVRLKVFAKFREQVEWQVLNQTPQW